MTARYGDRTRVTSPVGSWGRDAVGDAPVKQPYEEVFTAPGTWTWPGNVEVVEVTVVGGGGAGLNSPPFRSGGGGGGGGVRRQPVVVSGPVPVTVGAGGTVSPGAAPRIGGTSSFGPLSPPAPASTLAVDGGGGGNADAPVNGGGGGGTFASPGSGSFVSRRGGRYGGDGGPGLIVKSFPPTDAGLNSGGGAGGSGGMSGGLGKFGYGGGGSGGGGRGGNNGTGAVDGGGVFGTFGTSPGARRNGMANTGGGGASDTEPSASFPAGNGGSGVVVVRWFE